MIIDMRKAYLVGLEKDKEAILKAFQQSKSLEIVETEEYDEEWFSTLTRGGNESRIESLERDMSELEFALRFLSERAAVDKKDKSKIHVTDVQLEEVMSRRDEIMRIVEKCRSFEAEENEIDSRKSRKKAAIDRFLPWMGLNLSVEDIRDTGAVKVRAGFIAKSNVAPFLEAADALDYCVLKSISEAKDYSYYFLACHDKQADDLFEIARKYDFTYDHFEGYEGTPEEIIKNLENKLHDLYVQKDTLHKRALEMSESIADIKMLIDALRFVLLREEASSRFVNTGKVFGLKGWVREPDQQKVEDILDGVTGAYHIEFVEPDEGEAFPVDTRNSPVVEPFEVVTNLYSVPDSRGIDPNAVVAPFHALFLGLMMADVAYGLIMIIGGYLFIKLKDPEGGIRKLAGVVVLSGVFSIVWGVLLGSYFGDLGQWFGIRALLINPMDNPVEMLVLCLGLGVLNLFVGLGVKAYAYIKKGKYIDVVFDVVFWYLLLIGLGLMATPYSGIAGAMSIVGALGLVLTQGREKDSIMGKIAGGLGSLYGVTGYLSDVLSYSRLFALLLATAVVSMVMNQIAAMVGTNVIGYVAAALIFVAGHTFNLFIGGLGAFVHGSRLIFVEFFSKFFTGGGHAFSPLQKETKYVKLNK